ncbi:hypothetical protein IT413_02620 [Candidatus Peregrinibacteria bacterium]|nr:hypothetical protein [Candidatus Peregrinibacteria bacterium]
MTPRKYKSLYYMLEDISDGQEKGFAANVINIDAVVMGENIKELEEGLEMLIEDSKLSKISTKNKIDIEVELKKSANGKLSVKKISKKK